MPWDKQDPGIIRDNRHSSREDDYTQVRTCLAFVRDAGPVLRAQTRDHRGPRGLVFLALLRSIPRDRNVVTGATRRLRYRPADVNKETCARRGCRTASIFLSPRLGVTPTQGCLKMFGFL